jgi:type IV pilus assembly protein PilC
MALFKYKPFVEKGGVIKDINNKLYSASTKGRIKISLFKSKASKRDISIFCRQFSTMLKAGISLVNTLDVLIKQAENKALEKAVLIVYEDVHRGVALSTAMKRHSNVFPELLINMIEVGETTGNLDVIMERMAFHYESEYKIDNKIKSALVYPTFLSIMTIIVIIFLLTKVLPSYIEIFSSNELMLPMTTRIMLSVSKWLTNYWYVLILMLVLIISSIKYLSKTEKGIFYIDSLKLKVPAIKRINIKIINTTFARTMSILLSSGISLLHALDVVKKVAGNKLASHRLEIVKKSVQNGVSFSEALKEAEIFEPIVYSMVRVGEESGALDKLLHKTAEYFDGEIEQIMQRITTLVEPILIVLMALIIGFIVVSMVMPMFDMINSIQI